MPKEKVKSKGRGRKRKVSLPLEPEESSDMPPGQPAARENDASGSATNNERRYVPRFGSAAKRQRVESLGVAMKQRKDASEEGEEQVLCPISCTQPVGGARETADLEGEWSSTQPAHRLSSVSKTEVEPTNNLSPETKHSIPDRTETKKNEACFVPGLALSQSLPPSPEPNDTQSSPNPAINNSNDNETGISTKHDEDTLDTSTDCDEHVEVNANASNTEQVNKRRDGDKCLDFLNPLGEALDDSLLSTANDNFQQVSDLPEPTESVATIESHRNEQVSWPHSRVEDAVLPSGCPDKVSPETIVESFYSLSSQEDKGKQTSNNLSAEADHLDKAPTSMCALDEVAAMKEMDELRAVDLLEEDSQVFGRVAASDQAAPVHSPATNTQHVVSEGNHTGSSPDAPLQEGTEIVRGLINELSALNRFVVHCKKELESTFRQHRANRHHSGLHVHRNYSTNKYW